MSRPSAPAAPAAASTPPWLSGHPGAWRLALAITPGAKKHEVIGQHGDRLKLKIAAPPVDGAANQALIQALAHWLSCPKQAITLITGLSSRQKSVLLELDLSEAQVVERLNNVPTLRR